MIDFCKARHPERKGARCFLPVGHGGEHCASIPSPDKTRARLGWNRTLKWRDDEHAQGMATEESI